MLIVVEHRCIAQTPSSSETGRVKDPCEFSPVTPWPPTRFQRVPFCPLLLLTLFVISNRFFFLLPKKHDPRTRGKGCRVDWKSFQCCIRTSKKKFYLKNFRQTPSFQESIKGIHHVFIFVNSGENFIAIFLIFGFDDFQIGRLVLCDDDGLIVKEILRDSF